MRLAFALLLAAAPAALAAVPRTGAVSGSEIPAHFAPPTDRDDYIRREVMISMRDGVNLFTVIWMKKGVAHAPILLTRTPYNANDRFADRRSISLRAAMDGSDVADELVAEDGYIRAIQDVRGKYKSGGIYVMNPPVQGPLSNTGTDDATDAADTIDWLAKNVPESNGRVGITGISYDGFTSLMALYHPSGALKAAVPINPMVDGWMGDDWFHKGAFRQDGALQYAFEQEANADSSIKWKRDAYDDYQSFLDAGSADGMAKLYGLDQLGFWQRLSAHPAYDAFWQGQALDKILAKQKLAVPTLLVHSLWDQEDIYGALATWKAWQGSGNAGDNLRLVLGPWFHHQARLDGSAIGPVRFGADTAAYFRHDILKPFLDRYLKGDASTPDIARVTAYETGTNTWRRYASWPAPHVTAQKFYLGGSGTLTRDAPAAGGPGYAEYVSDPAHPVPFLPRPVNLGGEEGEHAWQSWLVEDQRNMASRPDVLSFTSEVLTAPLKLAGEPVANIAAAISGTDVDLVLKVIDVYPAEMGREPAMGGYQLAVSEDILRGRYRESFSDPKPVPSGQRQTYRFSLPTAHHVFLPGHRIMVQVQSSWFPLYDRNPQTYVDNIMAAQPGDFKAETVRVFDAGPQASFVELPLAADQGDHS